MREQIINLNTPQEKLEYAYETITYAERELGLLLGKIYLNIEESDVFKKKGSHVLYIGKYNTIFIEQSWLDDSSITILSVVDCILHECRHAYQYAVTMHPRIYKGLESKETTKLWKEELTKEYIEQSEDLMGYYNQATEIDARNWEEIHFKKLTGLDTSEVFTTVVDLLNKKC
jgi:hypothetical protein